MANENGNGNGLHRLENDIKSLVERFEDRIANRNEQDNAVAQTIARLTELSRGIENRVGDVERRLTDAEEAAKRPTDWGKILTPVLASAALVGSLTNYAIGNIERRMDADERVIIKIGEKTDKLDREMAAGQVIQQRNTEWIRTLENRVGEMQAKVATVIERVRGEHSSPE